MPARKKEPDRWYADAESSSASGGNISAGSSGPLFEPVMDLLDAADDPAPSRESAEDSEEASTERTEVIPRGAFKATDSDRSSSPGRARAERDRTRPAVRRIRRTLRHIDPVSVLKLSLFYYGCFLLLWLGVVAIVFGVLASAGLFDRIEILGRRTALWETFDITLWFVERWAFIIGLALALVASFVNVFLAFLYNLAADVVGGAEMTFVEREL
ncbi:MAG: DUF3566 domain-containing protein [Actinomycetota bacterium]